MRAHRYNEMWVLTTFILLLGVLYEKLDHFIRHSGIIVLDHISLTCLSVFRCAHPARRGILILYRSSRGSRYQQCRFQRCQQCRSISVISWCVGNVLAHTRTRKQYPKHSCRPSMPCLVSLPPLASSRRLPSSSLNPSLAGLSI